ncbi:MAG: branched-chain amino acid ABC transporter permease [Aeromicrobium sp.]
MDAIIILLVSAMSLAALYFLLASGLGLIFGLMNILSFAHGAFLAVGAYAAYQVMANSGILYSSTPLSWLGGVALAMAIGGILAWVTEIFLIRPLYDRSHMDQLLVTMGLGFIIIALIQGIWGPDSLSTPLPPWFTETTPFLGAEIPNDRFVIIITAILLYIGIEVFLKYTRHGLIVRAGVENREMVRALGIDVRQSFNLVFVIAGVTAGLGGALAATYHKAVFPLVGDSLLLFSFIVLIVGGLGSMKGALVASFIVGVLQVFANFYIGNGVGEILVIVLLAAMLLFRPQGIFGRKGRLV